MIAVAGLLVIVAIVFYQVFGRYVLNDTPDLDREPGAAC